MSLRKHHFSGHLEPPETKHHELGTDHCMVIEGFIPGHKQCGYSLVFDGPTQSSYSALDSTMTSDLHFALLVRPNILYLSSLEQISRIYSWNR